LYTLENSTEINKTSDRGRYERFFLHKLPGRGRQSKVLWEMVE